MDMSEVRAYAAALRAQRELGEALAFAAQITLRTVRERSLGEADAVYHPPNYGVMFCLHDKMYFHACVACRRTVADGEAKREQFMRKHGIVV